MSGWFVVPINPDTSSSTVSRTQAICYRVRIDQINSCFTLASKQTFHPKKIFVEEFTGFSYIKYIRHRSLKLEVETFLGMVNNY